MKPYNERLPLIDAAVIELKDFNSQDCWRYKDSDEFLWIADGLYQRLDSPHGYRGKYVCTRDEFNQRKAELDAKEQDMNDWYEKGELPPVGTECEVNHIGEWKPTVIVGYDGELPVFKTEWNDRYKYACGDDFKFRPLRTETDKLVDDIFSVLDQWPEVSKLEQAKLLIEQGYRKIKPMSEQEFMKNCVDICDHGDARLYRAGCRFLDQGE